MQHTLPGLPIYSSYRKFTYVMVACGHLVNATEASSNSVILSTCTLLESYAQSLDLKEGCLGHIAVTNEDEKYLEDRQRRLAEVVVAYSLLLPLVPAHFDYS
eukprot:1119764-Amorphochlora_amoeboformis.AAC.1